MVCLEDFNDVEAFWQCPLVAEGLVVVNIVKVDDGTVCAAPVPGLVVSALPVQTLLLAWIGIVYA